jgi:hypothetical protein
MQNSPVWLMTMPSVARKPGRFSRVCGIIAGEAVSP